MNKEQILNTIKKLGRSQGFYSRLYNALINGEGDDFLNELEKQNFKDSVDLVLYLES